jgi:hypothetical protein
MGIKIDKPTAKAKDAKVIAGIEKNLAAMAVITLNGKQFTPAQLQAVFQADSVVIDATEAAHKALQQAVLNEQVSRTATGALTRALRNFVLANYGEQAVAILGDFGFTARATATTTVATKALAAAKAAATRKARNTMGSVQRKDVTGGLTTAVLTQAGTGATLAPQTATGNTPAANAPAAAPQTAAGAGQGATPNAQNGATTATPPATPAKAQA